MSILLPYQKEDTIEIGIDEAGRGCLLGDVFIAGVILPQNILELIEKEKKKVIIRDSKKLSKKKRMIAKEFIERVAIDYCVVQKSNEKIDEINILQATQMAMHNAILEVKKNYNKHLKEKGKKEKTDYNYNLLIDGNYFNPITTFNKETNKIETIPYMTVEGGDNKYASIAAASILAKVERDRYIEKLCQQNPELSEHYGIDSNKGYGAKRHIDGIKEHGITIWHRRTFAPCKNYV